MWNLRLKAPADVVEDYFHLFVNRRAYTLQSNRPHRKVAGIITTVPRTGKPARSTA
jgi:hypothetical protein